MFWEWTFGGAHVKHDDATAKSRLASSVICARHDETLVAQVFCAASSGLYHGTMGILRQAQPNFRSEADGILWICLPAWKDNALIVQTVIITAAYLIMLEYR